MQNNPKNLVLIHKSITCLTYFLCYHKVFRSVQKPFSSSWKCIAHKAWHWILPQFHGLLIHAADKKTIVTQKPRATLHHGKNYVLNILFKFLSLTIQKLNEYYCLVLSYHFSKVYVNLRFESFKWKLER